MGYRLHRAVILSVAKDLTTAVTDTRRLFV